MKMAAILLCVAVLAGCSSSGRAKAAPPIAVRGTVVLTDPQSTLNALLTGTHDCAGVGGYSDVTQGGQVVISDDSGKTLTIAALSAGQTPTVTTGVPHDCDFTFTASVPAGKKFYGVTVTHRGTVKMPEAEMASPKIHIGG